MKVKVKSQKARVSILYLEDMKKIQKMLNNKYNLDFSLPATYNLIRPEFLRAYNQRIAIFHELQKRKTKQKLDIFKLLK